MDIDLVVVDGPNLFNSLGTALTEKRLARAVGGYLRDWFHFDRLVRAPLSLERPLALGTVAFHSGKALGRRDYSIDAQDVDAFWGRQRSNPESSCLAVTIPGQQKSIGTGPR